MVGDVAHVDPYACLPAAVLSRDPVARPASVAGGTRLRMEDATPLTYGGKR
jgi:hypothetical protein